MWWQAMYLKSSEIRINYLCMHMRQVIMIYVSVVLVNFFLNLVLVLVLLKLTNFSFSFIFSNTYELLLV